MTSLKGNLRWSTLLPNHDPRSPQGLLFAGKYLVEQGVGVTPRDRTHAVDVLGLAGDVEVVDNEQQRGADAEVAQHVTEGYYMV